MAVELDVERVICRLSRLEDGARAFTRGGADCPLRGFVVKVGDAVRGYLNRCPHAGHPLAHAAPARGAVRIRAARPQRRCRRAQRASLE